jgi:hypothetical protein
MVFRSLSKTHGTGIGNVLVVDGRVYPTRFGWYQNGNQPSSGV